MQEEFAGAVKVAPPMAVTGAIFMGFTLNEWAAITAIFYACLQTFFLLKDRWTKHKQKKKEE